MTVAVGVSLITSLRAHLAAMLELGQTRRVSATHMRCGALAPGSAADLPQAGAGLGQRRRPLRPRASVSSRRDRRDQDQNMRFRPVMNRHLARSRLIVGYRKLGLGDRVRRDRKARRAECAIDPDQPVVADHRLRARRPGSGRSPSGHNRGRSGSPWPSGIAASVRTSSSSWNRRQIRSSSGRSGSVSSSGFTDPPRIATCAHSGWSSRVCSRSRPSSPSGRCWSSSPPAIQCPSRFSAAEADEARDLLGLREIAFRRLAPGSCLRAARCPDSARRLAGWSKVIAR